MRSRGPAPRKREERRRAMDLNLAGKSVIVTGGGSNIGRAISLAFARERSHVTIADVDEAQAKKVAAEGQTPGAAAGRDEVGRRPGDGAGGRGPLRGRGRAREQRRLDDGPPVHREDA